MKHLSAFLGAILLLTGLPGCQKTAVAPREPVTCAYQVLNSKGEETTVFTQGQEVFFRYTISNNTDQEVFLKNNGYEYDHFMEVFAERNGQLWPLGKPYASIAHPYIGYFNVAPHGALTQTLAWVESAPSQDVDSYTPAANSPLPPGSYRTSMVPRVVWNHPAGPETALPVVAQHFVRRFEVR